MCIIYTRSSQLGGPLFESAGSGSSALGQGTLSSLSSPSEILKAGSPLVTYL